MSNGDTTRASKFSVLFFFFFLQISFRGNYAYPPPPFDNLNIRLKCIYIYKFIVAFRKTIFLVFTFIEYLNQYLFENFFSSVARTDRINLIE